MRFLAILTVTDESGAVAEGHPLLHLFKSLRSAKGWIEHVAEVRSKVSEESGEGAYAGPWWVECAEVYEADSHGALKRVDYFDGTDAGDGRWHGWTSERKEDGH